MPKARSSDRSLASPVPAPVPPTSFTLLLRGCRLHSGLETSASPLREEHQPPREVRTAKSASKRASEQGWMEVREGVGRQRGATVGGGYPTRYLNLRLPRGRAQKCKAIVSRPRPVSSALWALFSTPRKGVTYRDTRESTEGLDISRRSAAVVAAWFRARFTARERTTYGILVEVR